MQVKIYKIIPVITFAFAMASCSKKEVTIYNKVDLQASNGISSDTIPAFAKGTLLEGKTYYIMSDVTVQKGDTLYAQPGANVIVKNNARSIYKVCCCYRAHRLNLFFSILIPIHPAPGAAFSVIAPRQ